MRRSVGRGRTAPTRVRSSSCSAPTLSGPSSMRTEPLVRHAPAQPERRLVAGGQDRGDRLRLEAGRANRSIASEGASSHWTSSIASRSRLPDGELPQGAQEGECDHALLGRWTFGFRERERGFERPPLRPRQLRQHVGKDASDQVGQPDERERRFRFGRPAGEHQISARLRRLDGGEPQRRLADPGLAGDDSHGGQPIAGVREEQGAKRAPPPCPRARESRLPSRLLLAIVRPSMNGSAVRVRASASFSSRSCR